MNRLFNPKIAWLYKMGISRPLYFFLFSLLLFNASAFAQNSVTGTIIDSKTGESIPGANVVVKGTSIGVMSNENGSYSISIPSDISDPTLVFSFIGFLDKEEIVGNRSVIDVGLSSEISKLDEVVVVGYGTQRKGEVTSAVSSIKAAEFNKAPVIHPMQLVEGRIAGLTVSRNSNDPNAVPAVQMRGVSSLNGNNEPLVIIDGVPGNMSSLNAIAPEDIGSIDVLKDGSAAAIYGTRGNNGVVIVTTKRPQVGMAQIDYSGYITHERIAKRPDILSGDEFAAYGKATENPNIVDFGGRDDAYDLLLNKNNISHVHSLSATGGNNQINYRASVNYKKNEAIPINTDRETINGSIAANHHSFNNKLLLSFNLSNTFIKTNFINQNRDNHIYSSDNSIFYEAIRRNPTIPIYKSNGDFYENYSGYEDWNPVARANQRKRRGEYKNLLGNFKATYELIPGLKTSVFVALEKNDAIYNEYNLIGEYSSVKDNYQGMAYKQFSLNTNKTFEWTTNYIKTINNHNINILAGYSHQSFETERFAGENRGFVTDAFGSDNLGAGSYLKSGKADLYSLREDSKLISFFSRLNYNFQGKYLFSASIRREGSSKFGANNKWGWFPAISAGWLISSEEFMLDMSVISSLKFRIGYGVTGSLPNDNYVSLIKYSTGAGYWDAFNERWLATTYGAKNNPNPDLRWEKNKSLNIGFDYALLGGKVSGTIDWYQRITSDLIASYSVSQPSNIYPTMLGNIGEIKNSGIEFNVNVEVISNKNFSYNTGLVFSYEKNELTYLPRAEDRYSLPSPGNIGYAQRLEQGRPVGSFFGYVSDGITKDGKWIIRDLDGEEGLSNNDRTFIGNGLPKFKVGLINNFRYKNFDFSFFLRGMFDYDILNEGRIYFGTTRSIDKSGTNVYRDALKTKLTEDPVFSNYFLEKGNFLRIDNVTLGYTFNFEDNSQLRNLRVYTNITNLATFTNYRGLNPDIPITGLEAGIDKRGSYPLTRIFMFGINIGF